MASTADTLIGTVLGGCKIERFLGGGAMGSVYLARHLALQKDVAIKILAGKLSGAPEYVQRFLSEARLAAQIEHPNIVHVLNVGRENGFHYIVMQYVQGETLAALLAREGKRPPPEAARITLCIARGLVAAHEKGIIHRDIKPSNVLMLQDGNLKIADMGLARTVGQSHDSQLTQEGVPMGTPQYMPPEQAEDARSADERSDIYSLGCTLYHMLVGAPPFAARSPIGVITKHLTENAAPPLSLRKEVPPALSELTMAMMAKRREDRPQTMKDIVAELEAIGAGRGVIRPVRSAPRDNSQPRPLRRKIIAAAVGAIGAMVLLILLTRPRPGQHAYERTLSAWDANPTEYAAAITAFEDVARRYPSTRYAEQSNGQVKLIKDSREKTAVSVFEQTRQISESARNAGDHAKALKVWDEFPGPLLDGEIVERARRERMKARLPVRIDGFLKAMVTSDINAALKFLDPDEMAARGRDFMSGVLNLTRGLIAIGFEAEGWEIKSMTLAPDEKSADAIVILKLFNKFAKKSETKDTPESWHVVNGDWYRYTKMEQKK